MRGATISPYTITFILAFLISFAIVFLLLKKRGMPLHIIGYSLLLNVVMILYLAKLFTVITGGFRLNILNAGMSSLGGAIGLLAGVFIMGCIYREGKKEFWECYVTVIPLMYAISKIGCYFVGCCHGVEYEGFWAVSYDGIYMQGGPYFPVQLLESIVFFLIFFLAAWMYFRGGKGYVFPVIMILSAISKFSMDFLRAEHAGKIFSPNQWVCIGFFIWGLWILCWKKRKNHKTANE